MKYLYNIFSIYEYTVHVYVIYVVCMYVACLSIAKDHESGPGSSDLFSVPFSCEVI